MKTAATIIICCVAALVGLGWVMLYSCNLGNAGAKYLVSQITWFGIGIVPCVIAACIHYRRYKVFIWPLYVVTLVLLVLVFVPPIGLEVKGANRWINLGAFRFQPSEMAKIVMIMVLAVYCEKYEGQLRQFRKGILIPLTIMLPVLVLICEEKDRGTTALLGLVCGLVMLVAGMRLFYLITAGAAGAGVMAVMLIADPLRMRRLTSWLDPEAHRLGTGYQAWQAQIALGAGGLFGVGLGNSVQKLGLVPDRHTDFILSIIGEELGLVGTLLLLVMYLLIFLAGLYVTIKTTDMFARCLAAGLTFLITCQAMVNVGVVTSVFPTKGLPLPFVSYGGSSLLLMLTAVGMLLSVALHTVPEKAPAKKTQEKEPDLDNPFSARSKLAQA